MHPPRGPKGRGVASIGATQGFISIFGQVHSDPTVNYVSIVTTVTTITTSTKVTTSKLVVKLI